MRDCSGLVFGEMLFRKQVTLVMLVLAAAMLLTVGRARGEGVSAIYREYLRTKQTLFSLRGWAPEVEVGDLVALAYTELHAAGRSQGKESQEHLRRAQSYLEQAQKRHLDFARGLEGYSSTAAPFLRTFYTLPEFYYNFLDFPRQLSDPLERFLRRQDTPQPQWLWLDGMRTLDERKRMLGEKGLHFFLLRHTFNLDKKPARGWVQCYFFTGGSTCVNGQDVTGWRSGQRFHGRFDITEHLRQGKNVISMNVHGGPLIGFMLRGAVELSDGSMVPILSGNGDWKMLPPGPHQDQAWNAEEWRQTDFDDSAWPRPDEVPDCFIGPTGRFIQMDVMDFLQRDIKVSRRVVTEHTSWARPYAGGPVKALVIAPFGSQRETVELAERMDLDYTVEMAWQGQAGRGFLERSKLRQKLQEDYDVIVLGWNGWNHLPEEDRKSILQKAREGTGFVYVGTRSGLDGFFKQTLKAEAEPLPGFLKWVPLGELPVLEDLKDEGDVLEQIARCCTLGKGRVVMLGYPRATTLNRDAKGKMHKEDFAATFNCLTPDTEYYPGIVRVSDYDYYLSLVAKALLWAAQKEPRIQIASLAPAEETITEDQMPPVKLKAEIGGMATPDGAEVSFVIRNEVGDVLANVDAQWSVAEGKPLATAAVPDLPDGRFFLDACLRREGKVEDWASTAFTVSRATRFSSVKTDRDRYEPGDDIRVNVVLAAPLDGPAELVVELITTDGRVIQRLARKLRAAQSEEKTNVSVPNLGTTKMTVLKVALQRSGDLLDEERIELGIKQRYDGDFLWGIWPSPGSANIIPRQQLWKHYHLMGVDMISPNMLFRRSNPRGAAEADLWSIPYAGRYIDLPLRPRDWKAPPWQDEYNQRLARAEGAWEKEKVFLDYYLRDMGYVKYGPPAYSLGDDVGLLNVDTEAPEYVAGLRDSLKQRYANDLSALNRTWGTHYASWDEIVPMTEEDKKQARSKRSYARWLDQTAYQEGAWLGLMLRTRDLLRQWDPGARVGFEGAFADSGIDVARFLEELDFMGGYPQIPYFYVTMPLLCSPRTLRSTWNGDYNGEHRMEGYIRYQMWYLLFNNYNTTLWWHAMSRTDRGYMIYPGLIGPDLNPGPQLRWGMEEIKAIKDGPGRLLLGAEPEFKTSPIAIYYSHRSDTLTMLDSPTATRHESAPPSLGWSSRSWYGFHRLFEDLGLWPRYVTEEQLAGGDLAGVRLLVLPYSASLSSKELAVLRGFAQNGGTILTDVRPGIFDEKGRAVDAGPGADLFGIAWPNRPPQPERADAVLTLAGQEYKVPNAYADASAQLKGGEPMGRAGAIPIFIRHPVGKGQVITTNIPMMLYVGDGRAPGRDDPFLYEDSYGGRRCAALRRVFRAFLEGLGLRPFAHLQDAEGRPLPGLVRHWEGEGAIYLGVLRHRPGPFGGPEQFQIRLPRKYHVHDIIEGRYLGLTDRIEAQYRGGAGHLFALLPYEVKGVRIEAPRKSVHRGGSMTVGAYLEISGTGAAAGPGLHVYRVVVRNPRGEVQRHLTRTYLAPAGRVQIALPFAFNAAPGQWMLTVTEAATGLAGSVQFLVQ